MNSDQIATIRKAKKIVGQTDDQIATGVVVSYIERSRAKPHLSITSFAYTKPVHRSDDKRLNIAMSEGKWRNIDDLCVKKKVSRGTLIRWIIADTAESLGYPR